MIYRVYMIVKNIFIVKIFLIKFYNLYLIKPISKEYLYQHNNK